MPLAHTQPGSGAGKSCLALNLSSQILRLFLYGGLPLLQTRVSLNSFKTLEISEDSMLSVVLLLTV